MKTSLINRIIKLNVDPKSRYHAQAETILYDEVSLSSCDDSISVLAIYRYDELPCSRESIFRTRSYTIEGAAGTAVLVEHVADFYPTEVNAFELCFKALLAAEKKAEL